MERTIAILILVWVSSCSLRRTPLIDDHDGGAMDAPAGRDTPVATDVPDALDAGADVPTDAPNDAQQDDVGCVMGDRVLQALPAGPIVVDGALGDWDPLALSLVSPADFTLGRGDFPADAADLSARVGVSWSDTEVFVAVDVMDDRHRVVLDGMDTSQGDALWLSFDIGQQGGDALDDDDFVISFVLLAGLVVSTTVVSHPTGAPTPTPSVAISRGGGHTIYELSIVAADLGLAGFDDGTAVGLGVLLGEEDARPDLPREGYLHWPDDLDSSTRPGGFGTLITAATPCL